MAILEPASNVLAVGQKGIVKSLRHEEIASEDAAEW
jgi:hypothetical protein